VLTTALGASGASVASGALCCDLCQRSIATSESFAEHVARDSGHIAQVQARFEQEGQNGRGWVQSWAGVAKLNHLTLEVSIDEQRRGQDASTLDATKQQQCQAAQGAPVTSRREGEHGMPSTAAAKWEVYLDPTSGNPWYLNSKTEEVSWNNPAQAATTGLDHRDGTGSGGQEASTIAAVTAGTEDEDSTMCLQLRCSIGDRSRERSR